MRQGTLIPFNYYFNFNKPEVIGLKKNIDNGSLPKKQKKPKNNPYFDANQVVFIIFSRV